MIPRLLRNNSTVSTRWLKPATRKSNQLFINQSIINYNLELNRHSWASLSIVAKELKEWLPMKEIKINEGKLNEIKIL